MLKFKGRTFPIEVQKGGSFRLKSKKVHPFDQKEETFWSKPKGRTLRSKRNNLLTLTKKPTNTPTV